MAKVFESIFDKTLYGIGRNIALGATMDRTVRLYCFVFIASCNQWLLKEEERATDARDWQGSQSVRVTSWRGLVIPPGISQMQQVT